MRGRVRGPALLFFALLLFLLFGRGELGSARQQDFERGLATPSWLRQGLDDLEERRQLVQQLVVAAVDGEQGDAGIAQAFQVAALDRELDGQHERLAGEPGDESQLDLPLQRQRACVVFEQDGVERKRFEDAQVGLVLAAAQGEDVSQLVLREGARKRGFGVEDEEVGAGFEERGDGVGVDLLGAHAGSGELYQPVRLAKVGRRLTGVPSAPVLGEIPAADAIVMGHAHGGKTLVRPIRAEAGAKDRLIIAGCDPAMPMLARQVRRWCNIELIIAMCSSRQALQWLGDRRIHIAGTHLSGKSPGTSNLEVIRRLVPGRGVRVVTFASWDEGLVVAAANPKGISGVGDLVRPEVTIINREVGAGARLLLDTALKKEGISSANVCGYGQTAAGHVMAAWHVQSGKADCCVATGAAARVFGLHFIPLACERYDLVIPECFLDLPAVQAVLDTLTRASFRSELETLGGYDTSQTGRLVS